MSKQSIIDVDFAGGMKVNAVMGDTTIATDQPVKDGGEGSAPTPFALFLASLATCAGVYAKRFCETRKLSTEGLAIRAICTYADKGFHVDNITFQITLPTGFPQKYQAPFTRAVNLCAVKKHLADPPTFEIELIDD